MKRRKKGNLENDNLVWKGLGSLPRSSKSGETTGISPAKQPTRVNQIYFKTGQTKEE